MLRPIYKLGNCIWVSKTRNVILIMLVVVLHLGNSKATLFVQKYLLMFLHKQTTLPPPLNIYASNSLKIIQFFEIFSKLLSLDSFAGCFMDV